MLFAMGRNTDKLYVTQTEYSGAEGRHGSSTGMMHKKSSATYKRLPYIYCSLSLQAWEHPVCTVDEAKNATIFDLLSIVPWIQQKGTNPINGRPLNATQLTKLNFAKNEQNENCDPVTMKVFNDHTHIVALDNTGNVYAYETIERLNYKAKHWKDLLTDEPFSRANVITLQDPHNLGMSNDMSNFSHLQDRAVGTTNLRQVDPKALDPSENEKKIQAARDAIDRLRTQKIVSKASPTTGTLEEPKTTKSLAYNAANYSTGYTAASFTSTGMAVKTANDRAILSEEQYLLHPKKVKIKGLAIIKTNHGNLDIELWPEHAPKAVYNFVKLAKSGYYADVIFHRSIPGFMLQGGDPSGRGTGGKSIFGKDFEDEISPSHSHNKRGILSMANKGPGTNSSQFFITYDSAKHLDKKHTIFGQVIGNLETLDVIEQIPVSGDRPKLPVSMTEVQILVDPFNEYLEKDKARRDLSEKKHEITEDDLQTWNNQPVKTSSNSGAHGARLEAPQVGKYLSTKTLESSARSAEEASLAERPTKKTKKLSGFGNFSGW